MLVSGWALISAKKISERLYQKRLRYLYTIMVWGAVGISIPITFFSDFIIQSLYGMEYREGSNVLSIHVWAGVFVALGLAASKWVVTENLTKNAFLRTFVAAIINVVLNYILIPKLSLTGAAIVTLISYFFANYFSLFFWKRTRTCFYQQTLAFIFR